MLDQDFIDQLKPELTLIRRDLHAHPELRHEEVRTADAVAAQLERWGIAVQRGIGGHGVVGVLRSGTSARSVGLRADMDALPMQELNTFDYASKHAGKMHACGHDGHTAMLLGAARYLAEHRDFDGTVTFVFQPAEEGGAGAKLMIEDGLFERFPMDAIFGMHNWPGLAAGAFGVRAGAMMASSNSFEVQIRGVGAHAAQPQRSVDPVVVAIQIAQAWQSIVSRNLDPNDAAVLSVTQIHAGTAVNVIPEHATLAGTVRAYDDDVLDLIERRMRSIAEGIASGFGSELSFEFRRLYPPLINHEAQTALALNVMRSLVGDGNVSGNIAPSTAAEDFSFFLQHKPGCYAFIGNGASIPLAAGGTHPCQLHSATYDFNDEILPVGVAYWVSLAHAFLARANDGSSHA